MKQYKRLTYDDRVQIEHLLKQGVKPYAIAQILGFMHSSIYREIKLGNMNGSYSAEFSQKRYLELKSGLGRKNILVVDGKLAQYISEMILDEFLSPQEIIKRLKTEGYVGAPTSVRTIYTAIDDGLIPNVTRDTLLLKRKKTHLFSNGLLKVPQWVLKELHLADGEELDIVVDGDKMIFEKTNKNRIERKR